MKARLVLAAVAAILAGVAPPLGAADAPKSKPPQVGAAAQFAVSPPARDVARAPGAPAPRALRQGEARERPLGRLPRPTSRRALLDRPDPVVQRSAVSMFMPSPLLTFEGIGNADGVYPPDCNGDVGLDHYVEMVNLHMCIYDKVTGTNLVAPFLMSSLYAAAGLPAPASTTDDGDPVVLYDHLANRWLISQFIVSVTPCHEVVAISQTADPTGAWYLYDFVMPNTKMNDYPHFGVWPDGYYMTDNQFSGNSWGGAGVFVFDRAKMLAGDPSAGFQYFDLYGVNADFGGMLPADLDGPQPPAGTPCYFAMVDDSVVNGFDAMYIWEFRVNWTNAGLTTFGNGGQPNYTNAVAPFDSLFSGGRNNIPQPGTAQKLDAIADRLMHRVQYRNFGDHETLVASHTVDVDADHAGVRYYHFRRDLPAGTFAVADQATYAPDSAHRWMGSAALDGQGNLAVGFSCSSTSIYPSIRYAGRLSTDPTGGLFQGESVLQAGNGAQTGSAARWGDYSMLAVDPADEVTFWYVNEYYPSTAAVDWHTRIGTFRLGSAQQGRVIGVVTNAMTGEAIPGAQVATSLGFSTPTLTDGSYALALPTGQVTVAASAVDYEPSGDVLVEVQLNVTTEQNFALSPIPLRILPHGGLSASGLEGGPFAPASQAYVLANASALPLSWTASVDVAWAGLAPNAGSLAAGTSTTVVVAIRHDADFLATGAYTGAVSFSNLTASTGQSRSLQLAVAPYRDTIFCEDFAGGVPAGWAVRTNGAQVFTAAWRFDAPNGRANLTGGSGPYAAVDDDAHGSSVTTDTELISAPIDLAGLSSPVLEFKTDFRLDSAEVVDVDVSTNGPGGPWFNLWRKTATYHGSETLSLSAYGDATGLVVRFHYDDNDSWGWWWQVDDVCVKGVYQPTSGNLVVNPIPGFWTSGYAGGPFPGDRVYRLTNSGGAALLWAATPDVSWAEAQATGGTLAVAGSLDITVRVSGTAATLAPGAYAGALAISNLTQGAAQSRSLALDVVESLVVTPASPFASFGLEGGPFSPPETSYGISNASGQDVDFAVTVTSAWLTLSTTGGLLSAGSATAVTGVLADASLVVPGSFVDVVAVSNRLTHVVQDRAVTVTVREIRGDIAIYDSVAPTNDLQIPFGTVAPHAVATQAIHVVNSDPPGGRDLTVRNIFLGYLTEDFDDGFAQGWREDVPADWTVQEGRYVAQAPGENFLTSVYTDSVSRADLSLEALCSRVGDTGYSQGLALRASDDFDADGTGSAYLFVVDGSNSFGVFWSDGATAGALQGWATTTALLAGQTNRLAASAEGVTLRFFLNNTLVWSGTDSRFAAGRVALVGYDDGASQPAYAFDRVQVQSALRPVSGVGRKQLYLNGIAQPNSVPTGPARSSHTPPAEDPDAPADPLSPGADAAPFAITNLPATPITLAPGESFDLDVLYAPSAVGTNRNVVTFQSDDNEDPFVSADLLGRVAQGAITGLVASANSGLGLAGALVTADDGSTNWTTTTSGTGTYRLPVLAGAYTVSAQMAHYTTGVVEGVVVTDDANSTVNFNLSGSELTYAPTGMYVVLDYGQQQTNTLWLTNSGPLAVQVQLTSRQLAGNGPVSIPAFTGSLPSSPHAPSPQRAAPGVKASEGAEPVRAAPTRRLCYGVDMIAGQLVSFYSDAPETLTAVGATGANLIPCVDFLDYDFSRLLALDADANNLVRIAIANGAVTVVGAATPAAGQSWTGLAVAPDGTLYAASTDVASSKLYTVDPDTGAATFVGNITGAPGVIAIASDAGGQLYGLDIVNDNLVLIDRATGAGAVIGSVGFDANFAQGMDFDEADDVLYLAAYNNTTSRGELRTADLGTGNTALIGAFAAGAELCIAVVSEPAPAWLGLPAPSSSVPASASSTAPVVFDTRVLDNIASTNMGEVLFGGTFVNDPPRLPVTLVVVPDDLGVLPLDAVASTGEEGGPFAPAAHVFACTNWGAGTLGWSVSNDAAWIGLSATGGTLTAGTGGSVTASLNAAADALATGVYTARLHFVNQSSGMAQDRDIRLTINTVAPDYFTELFTGANDLDNLMLTFTPRVGAPYYDVCRSNGITAFAADPLGGTGVSPGDDGFVEVVLTGGLAVPFFGVARSNLFIGSNGYLTFESGDSTYDETVAVHFDRPRISLLFDDLNPASGGSVSWKQLPDRVAVTWQDVPQYGASDQNSFQAELFSNGTVRLTWLGIAASDGLAGLSQGLGTPVDFVGSDLTASDACTVGPPAALLVVTNPAAPLDVPVTQAVIRVTGYADTNVLSGQLRWSNQWSGAVGATALVQSWSAEVPLIAGTNAIRFTATNDPHTALIAVDHGTNSAYGDGWQDGDAGGSGWAAGWELLSWNGAGTFLIAESDPGNLSAGPRAWTLAASNGATAEVRREFSQAMSAGQTFSLRFDNNWIENGYSVGVGLQNQAGANLFEFMFIGGASTYVINDSTNGRATAIPWSGDGWDVSFSLTAPGQYVLTCGVHVVSGQLGAAGDQAPVRFKAWNYSAGSTWQHNVYLNDLRLRSALPAQVSTTVVVTITRPADSDSDDDGMADDWETANGLLVGVDDSLGNPDGDAWLNWQEYVADTPAQVSNDVLRVQIQFATGGVTVVAGPATTNSRQYDLQVTTNLPAGAWQSLESNVTGSADGSPLAMPTTNVPPIRALRVGVHLP